MPTGIAPAASFALAPAAQAREAGGVVRQPVRAGAAQARPHRAADGVGRRADAGGDPHAGARGQPVLPRQAPRDARQPPRPRGGHRRRRDGARARRSTRSTSRASRSSSSSSLRPRTTRGCRCTRASPDQIVGILHLKNVVGLLAAGRGGRRVAAAAPAQALLRARGHVAADPADPVPGRPAADRARRRRVRRAQGAGDDRGHRRGDHRRVHDHGAGRRRGLQARGGRQRHGRRHGDAAHAQPAPRDPISRSTGPKRSTDSSSATWATSPKRARLSASPASRSRSSRPSIAR